MSKALDHGYAFNPTFAGELDGRRRVGTGETYETAAALLANRSVPDGFLFYVTDLDPATTRPIGVCVVQGAPDDAGRTYLTLGEYLAQEGVESESEIEVVSDEAAATALLADEDVRRANLVVIVLAPGPDQPGVRVVQEDEGAWSYASAAGASASAEDLAGTGLRAAGGKLVLDTEATSLVAVVISAAGVHLWTIKKADGTVLSTSDAQSIDVPVGALVDLSAVFRYGAAGAGEALPTEVSGSFGSNLPGADTDSAAFEEQDLQRDTPGSETRSVTIRKPKSGLVVQGGQVQVASGTDSRSDTVRCDWRHEVYFGTVEAASPADVTVADVLALAARYGDKSENYSGVSDGPGERVCFAYPASYGELSSIILDGAAPVLGAFTRAGSVLTVPNAAGHDVDLYVYVANADNSYSGNSLAFS